MNYEFRIKIVESSILSINFTDVLDSITSSEKLMIYDLIVIGGGAAGFFGAINCAERNRKKRILILEKSSEVLAKVRVSGGGRCNVTYACFDPSEMILNYPRGDKELLGPFHKFLCGDMMGWLDEHGVETKIESDGRVFPVSNRSATIINCYMNLCQQYKIEIKTSCGVSTIAAENNLLQISSSSGNYVSRNILMATGNSSAAWKMLNSLGHNIVAPVPSLFTFKINHPIIEGLAGISTPNAEVSIKAQKFHEHGPLLITHWGLSGPAVLKISAWAARELFDLKYRFTLIVNWIGMDTDAVLQEIQSTRKIQGGKSILNSPLFSIPKRLWHNMIVVLKLEKSNFADLNTSQILGLVDMLCHCEFDVTGKSTFKDEFVTCGGIDKKEINFTTMESRRIPNLYFAGEIINIDAITGGFNFQAAWTTAYIAAEAITQKHN